MNLLHYSFIKYLTVGIFNTLSGLFIIFLLKFYNVGDILSNIIGYMVGIFISFTLNSLFTFRTTCVNLIDFIKFIFIIILSYIINIIIVMSLINFGVNSYVSQACGVPPYTIFSYIGCKFFIFNKKIKN